MDWKTFFSNVIDSISWPLAAGIVIFLLREPISKIISLLVKLKYKDFELEFRRDLEEAKDEVPNAKFKTKLRTKDDDPVLSLIKTSPRAAVIETWKILEKTAVNKLEELLPNNTRSECPHKLSTDYLIHTGVLVPSSGQLLHKLLRLRNLAVHSPEFSISKTDATEYYYLIKYLQSQIGAITELPGFKLTSLTYLIIEINHLIDTDRFNHITINKIEQEIENGTVLEYLNQEAKDDIDLSLILESNAYEGFKAYYIEQLQQLYNCHSGNERRKWGVEKKGLCLLLAWTNEIIQQGGGWYPSELKEK